MVPLNDFLDAEPHLEEIARMICTDDEGALELSQGDAVSGSKSWRHTEPAGLQHRTWQSVSEVDVRAPSHRRCAVHPAENPVMHVMRGSEAHVESLAQECKAKHCDPLGLAEVLQGTDESMLSSDWRHAAKQLRLSEFYARRIFQLWPEDQAAAIRLSLMVGIF